MQKGQINFARNQWASLVATLVWLGIVAAADVAVAQSSRDSKGAASARFDHLHDIPYKGLELPVTMIHDESNRPFLYVASKEAGLRSYDVQDAPRLARAIAISEPGSMRVMSLADAQELKLTQDGQARCVIVTAAKPSLEESTAASWHQATSPARG